MVKFFLNKFFTWNSIQDFTVLILKSYTELNYLSNDLIFM